MHGSWYNKEFPRIKDIYPFLKKIAFIKHIDGVKNLYVWGSYAVNIKNPSFRIKDIDILSETDFFSEDLISVETPILKQAKSNEELETEGFDPSSVIFSKAINDLRSPLFDSWAISKDKKLLHWGPIFTNKIDSDILKKEAENFAAQHTGVESKKVHNISDKHRSNWYMLFHDYYTKQIDGMPSGWYESEETEFDALVEKAIKI